MPRFKNTNSLSPKLLALSSLAIKEKKYIVEIRDLAILILINEGGRKVADYH